MNDDSKFEKWPADMAGIDKTWADLVKEHNDAVDEIDCLSYMLDNVTGGENVRFAPYPFLEKGDFTEPPFTEFVRSSKCTGCGHFTSTTIGGLCIDCIWKRGDKWRFELEKIKEEKGIECEHHHQKLHYCLECVKKYYARGWGRENEALKTKLFKMENHCPYCGNKGRLQGKMLAASMMNGKAGEFNDQPRTCRCRNGHEWTVEDVPDGSK